MEITIPEPSITLKEIEDVFPPYMEVDGKQLTRGAVFVTTHYYNDNFFEREDMSGLWQLMSVALSQITNPDAVRAKYLISKMSAEHHAREQA